MSRAYYNEIDPYCAQWLRNLIAAGHIAPGDVDERSIVDVRADDLRGYTQCHLFAGIAGWSLALRLAGWPDDRSVWTGSCPCQPFSAAGEGKAADDERHLWPQWFSLIRECRPATIFGEQVEAAIGWGWLDLVFSDLEAEGYACGASVLPACSVGAPHIRQRLWFVADAMQPAGERRAGSLLGAQAQSRGTRILDGDCSIGLADGGEAVVLADSECDGRWADEPQRQTQGREADGRPSRMADTPSGGRREFRDAPQPGRGGHADGGFVFDRMGNATGAGCETAVDESRSDRPAQSEGPADIGARGTTNNPWHDLIWLPCTDGKARPTQPGIFPLAHGVSARVGKLRAAGNAIVPQVAAEFIRSIMMPDPFIDKPKPATQEALKL